MLTYGGHREMAIYHFHVNIIKRSAGHSIVAAAAYRAGERIHNEHDGITQDYTKKKEIVFRQVLLPENAPEEYSNRAVLWNAVEKVERGHNAQLGRSIDVALPVELSRQEQIDLITEYTQKNFVNAGMCADVAIHDKKDGNPHAHILLTMRPINDDGTWGDKQKKVYKYDRKGNKIYDKKKKQYACDTRQTTNWNQTSTLEKWRENWARVTNEQLKKKGLDERIDHRSYQAQGVAQVPTIHMGAASMEMERKRIETARGNEYREIIRRNQEIKRITADIQDFEKTAENLMREESERQPEGAEMDAAGLKMKKPMEPRDAGLSTEEAVERLQKLRDSYIALDREINTVQQQQRERLGEVRRLQGRLERMNEDSVSIYLLEERFAELKGGARKENVRLGKMDIERQTASLERSLEQARRAFTRTYGIEPTKAVVDAEFDRLESEIKWRENALPRVNLDELAALRKRVEVEYKAERALTYLRADKEEIDARIITVLVDTGPRNEREGREKTAERIREKKSLLKLDTITPDDLQQIRGRLPVQQSDEIMRIYKGMTSPEKEHVYGRER
jgi:hypothetical protein